MDYYLPKANKNENICEEEGKKECSCYLRLTI